MFNNQHFYHQHIRKAIIAFGTIFNNINIRRKNANDEIVQTLVVPLSYAPKQKIIARVQEVASLEEGRGNYEVTLPRIGFEITSLNYDSSRKLVPIQQVKAINDATDTMRHTFVSTPYNMGISMSIFAKNQDDGLQILEQILPYFNPDFNVTVNELPVLNAKRDLQFILEGVNYNDEYEGNFDQRMSVIWDLNFTVKINFYGYVDNANVIKKTITSLYAENADATGIGTEITVTATGDAKNYTFVEEFDTVFLGD